IAGRPSGHSRMMPGINEVRSHLEGLHPTAPLFQSRQERQRHGGLANPAMRSRDDQSGEFHRHCVVTFLKTFKTITDATINSKCRRWRHERFIPARVNKIKSNGPEARVLLVENVVPL